MTGLDSDKLYNYLVARARRGQPVSEQEVAKDFGVELGGVKKRFSLLAKSLVVEETSEAGMYDCRAVLSCSQTAFESAGSQGKSNTEFVRDLKRKIDTLQSNNETMRQKLLRAQQKLRELGIDPATLE